MKKKLFTFFFIFSLIFGNAQIVHVRYLYVRSPVAVLYEDLYINKDKVISIQDSVVSKPMDNSSGWMSDVSVRPLGVSTRIVRKNNFMSNLSGKNPRKIFFNSAPYSMKDQNMYFIYDEVPVPVWLINEKETKKIAGYNCIKATTTFRGSDITAYFTKELPYSTGPFKFFGLPGLILDVRVNNKAYMIWRAEKVVIDDKTKINFNPQFSSYPKITMKDFVKLNDELSNNFSSELAKKLPPGTKLENTNKRFNVETVFEWEK
ncbi:GLPGLI family protein [Elizabethkingia meningoseptica]|uniref:GLPGLI family protein n=1 Tax=Elizabethkingia meningoseptica TaxID=238 RepID=UPI000B357B3E|nr:GLPGLI family protein [Elizabethkingia meningoseptica]